MGYLLDTNVLSELRKKRCNKGVRRWFESVDDDDLYLSVVVVGEIRRGVELIGRRDPAGAQSLDRWLNGLRRSYAERILAIDLEVAELWGRLSLEEPLALIPHDGMRSTTSPRLLPPSPPGSSLPSSAAFTVLRCSSPIDRAPARPAALRSGFPCTAASRRAPPQRPRSRHRRRKCGIVTLLEGDAYERGIAGDTREHGELLDPIERSLRFQGDGELAHHGYIELLLPCSPS